jgi:uncharacterized protein YggE
MKPSIFLFAILLTSPLLMAQAPTVNAAPNTLFTGADGKFDAPPDTALVQFNISAQAYSIEPMYDWKTAKRKLIGYRVGTSVTLKLKDFAKIGPLTQQLADAAVSESQSISYTLDNMDEAKSKAVEDAYRRARAAADSLARAAGRSVGELSYASVDTYENVRPIGIVPRVMAMKAEAAPAPTEEFSPHTVTVTAHVNALFSLK